MTARASDSMFLCIDFVRVTNCFYDYDLRVFYEDHIYFCSFSQAVALHNVRSWLLTV